MIINKLLGNWLFVLNEVFDLLSRTCEGHPRSRLDAGAFKVFEA